MKLLIVMICCVCLNFVAAENTYNYGDPSGGCRSDEIAGSLAGLETYDACFPKCLEYNNCPHNIEPTATAYGLC